MPRPHRDPLADVASLAESGAEQEQTDVRRRALLPVALRRLVGMMGEAAYAVDEAGSIAVWNRAAEALTGYRADDVLGRPAAHALQPVDPRGGACEAADPVSRALRSREPCVGATTLRHRDGHRLLVEVRAEPIVSHGHGLGVAGIMTTPGGVQVDAQELAVTRRLAYQDPVTGHGNRHYLEAHLDAALRHQVRALADRPADAAEPGPEDELVGLLLVDLDHFKQVNDAHGHVVGDQALRVVSSTLSANLRPGDVAGRWGGEEFLVVLPRVTSRDLVTVADRLRALIKRSWVPLADGGHFTVTASVGATRVRPGEDAAAALARVDALLYDSKHGGRDRITHDQRTHRVRRFSLPFIRSVVPPKGE